MDDPAASAKRAATPEKAQQQGLGGTQHLVSALRTEKYTDLAAEHGWEILPGTASFTAGPRLRVALDDDGQREIDVAHYVLPTGNELQ